MFMNFIPKWFSFNKKIEFIILVLILLYYLKVPNKQFLEGFKQPMLTNIPAF